MDIIIFIYKYISTYIYIHLNAFAIFIIFIVARGEINQWMHLRVRCVDFAVIFVFLLYYMLVCSIYLHTYLRTHVYVCVCMLCALRGCWPHFFCSFSNLSVSLALNACNETRSYVHITYVCWHMQLHTYIHFSCKRKMLKLWLDYLLCRH